MKCGAVALVATASAFAQQSALDPGGVNAERIKGLGTFFVWLLGAIFLAVILLALAALLRRGEPTERRLSTAVSVATAATVLILLGLVIVSVSVGKAVSGPANPSNALAIEVTGNQWWWYVRYPDEDASRIVVTANELHIPVGRPVMIRGNSNDVIHSFWVPGLQGKRDLIPGHSTTEWIEADKPGRFRGQCAEFCGLQHAHMAVWVIAEAPADFEHWLAHQTEPAAIPSDELKRRGQEVFLNSACVLCHSIQGTTAAGQVAPDLTHFGSRLTIAAGTLANNKGNLAGWISDPQSIKPGTHMATVPVASEDMQPLIEYLESLQ
jgi:cytochrome c oxidase subunit 2